MAVETGTATSYTDLLDKLVTFLTTDGDLVADGQEWEVLHTTSVGAEDDVLLRGPGLAGLDEIHIRLAAVSTPASDRYGIDLYGFDSYNAGVSHALQPGISPVCGVALWNSSIPYWFVANGRRFIVIAKVSTVYSSMYAGFFLPFATPTEFPYPIFVGASHEDGNTHRWSQATHVVGGFWDPSYGNAYLRHNDGTWIPFANYDDGTGGSRSNLNDNAIWPYHMDLRARENEDGSYTLLPTVLHSNYSSGNVYGELDGVFFTAGYGVGSEDTIVLSGDTHLIVQSVYRTTRLSYAAIKLE